MYVRTALLATAVSLAFVATPTFAQTFNGYDNQDPAVPGVTPRSKVAITLQRVQHRHSGDRARGRRPDRPVLGGDGRMGSAEFGVLPRPRLQRQIHGHVRNVISALRKPGLRAAPAKARAARWQIPSAIAARPRPRCARRSARTTGRMRGTGTGRCRRAGPSGPSASPSPWPSRSPC